MATVLVQRTDSYPLAATLSGNVVPIDAFLSPIEESKIGAKFTAVHIIKPPTEKTGYGDGGGTGTGSTGPVTVWTTG